MDVYESLDKEIQGGNPYSVQYVFRQVICNANYGGNQN